MRSKFLIILCAALAASHALALDLQRASSFCGATAGIPLRPPVGAAKRLADSQVTEGQRDIAWAWLESPTHRYPHRSFGSTEHAAALHVQVRMADGRLQDLTYQLPLNRVFEDLVPRLVDLDGDGRDEIVLVESDLLRGAALVVLGLRPVRPAAGLSPKVGTADAPATIELIELARSPFAGSSFLWLNPLGFADFDGDGRTDLAAVITPHIGGTLTLYHYRPPLLVPFAKATDVSNHRMGSIEQQLGVVLPPKAAGQRASMVVPDMTRRALHWLQWGADGQWREMSDLMALPGKVERMTAVPGGACLQMADGSWWKLLLTH